MGGTGSARELAEMLRQMGRGPDTMLAHITPEEAQMLLESGGSGRINPMTGLPEFQPEDDFYSPYGERNEPIEYSPVDYSLTGGGADVGGLGFRAPVGETTGLQLAPDVPSEGFRVAPGSYEAQSFFPYDVSGQAFTPQDQFVPQGVPQPAPVAVPQDFYSITGRGFPQAAMPAETPITPPQPTTAQQQSFTQQYPMLSRILTASLPSLPALYYAQRARREAGSAANELRRLGQPLREQGEALRRQALTGGLTPSQARQQEARKAQLLQSASNRQATTGTQEAMIENTLGRERAGLAEVNLNNAIKQLNLANAYDEAAIRAKLQSDAATANILANILGNITQSVAGMPMTQRQPSPQLTSPMPEQPVTRRAEVK